MLSENLQTPMKEKSGNLQHEASECEHLHELKIILMLFHKHLPYIHVTGFTQPDTMKNWQNYSYPQEENSRTNEKREIYAKPLLTFIVWCLWVEQIWYTPKGKSLLSKAAHKRMTDSWMVSVKQFRYIVQFELQPKQTFYVIVPN